MDQKIEVAGQAMPAVGLGLWKIDQTQTAETVYNAIRIGYRHLDSAADYGNEKMAGEGISKAISDGFCVRDDLWITSKLWNTFHRPEHVRIACEKSLIDLGLDYLDLYLIHFPIALKYVDIDERYPPEWLYKHPNGHISMELEQVPLNETWEAMEVLTESGLVRHIGVCNYTSVLLHDLMSYARVRPAMLQIESHPYLTQEAILRTAKAYDIAVTAFSPLAALSYVSMDMATADDSVLAEQAVIDAARRAGVTPAQVVLRWGVQRGTAIIPKTTNPKRLAENLSLTEFRLTAREMAAISALNKNRRFNDPGDFCEAAFGRFHSIYD